MNINIRHIEHFIAVAEELHFRRAAQITNVAQPVLSRSVQILETELGVSLLNRNNRNVTLTKAGEEFLAGSTEIIASMKDTISDAVRASQTQSGDLNLGYTHVTMSGMLPELIMAFEKQHPTISIEPTIASNPNLLEGLHHDKFDLCFHIDGMSDQNVSGLESVFIRNEELVVVAHEKHPIAQNDSVTPDDIKDETIIMSRIGYHSPLNQHVRNLFQQAGIDRRFKLIDQNFIGVVGQVASNKGIAVVANSGYTPCELKIIKITGKRNRIPTVMTWRTNAESESAETFREFVLANLPSESKSSIATKNMDASKPVSEPVSEPVPS